MLTKSPYSSGGNLDLDKKYFLNKMNWKESYLTNYIALERRDHTEFKSEKYIWNYLVKIYSFIK